MLLLRQIKPTQPGTLLSIVGVEINESTVLTEMGGHRRLVAILAEAIRRCKWRRMGGKRMHRVRLNTSFISLPHGE